MTSIRAAAASDTGRRRQKNDDTPHVSERLFAVADGMGGYSGGEVASATAIETLSAGFAQNPTAEGLTEAFVHAGRAVQTKAEGDPELKQMGTTLSVAALIESDQPGEGEVFALAHIGDSRIYLFRDGQLQQLSDDHTVPEDLRRAGQLSAEEAAVDPRRHIITRVLASGGDHQPDLQTLVPYKGDRLLLCSDGLTDELSDAQIADALRSIADTDDCATRLVEMANDRGGRDNITVVVVDVQGDDDRATTAGAALAAAGDPRTSTPAAAAARPAAKRGLMTAEERNAELRQLSRSDDGGGRRERDEGDRPAPWDSGDSFLDEADLPTRRFTMRVALFVVALLLVVGGAGAAVWWYATNSYFVGIDDDAGTVAIFKGRPGGLLFIQPENVATTDITEAQIPPARVDDIREGFVVSSLDDAQAYVARLEDTIDPGGTETIIDSTATSTPGPATSTPPSGSAPATSTP